MDHIPEKATTSLQALQHSDDEVWKCIELPESCQTLRSSHLQVLSMPERDRSWESDTMHEASSIMAAKRVCTQFRSQGSSFLAPRLRCLQANADCQCPYTLSLQSFQCFQHP